MVADKCKVCGGDLNPSDSSFCPKCGFEHHILPEPVSNEVRMYEEKRIRAYQKAWEEHNQRLEKFKMDYDTVVSKNNTLEDIIKEEKAKTRAAEQEKERYRTQVDKATKELVALKKENQGLVDNVQILTSQNQSLKTERDLALKEIEKLKQNPPVSAGAQLRIIEKHGKYRLQDTSGLVCRANGQSIGEHGIELYDGYVFKVGNVRFTVTVPELDITNINL